MVFWFNEDIKHQWEVLSTMYNFSILPRIHPCLSVAMLSSLVQCHHILHHNSCFGMSSTLVHAYVENKNIFQKKNILAASPGVLFVDSNYEEDLADAEPLRHSDLGSGSDTLSKAVSIPDMTMLRCWDVRCHDAGERQHHEHPGEPPQGLRQDRAPLLPLRWVFHSNQPGIYKYLLSM